MTEIINHIIKRITENGLELLKTTALAVGIFIVFLIIIKKIVTRVKQRIQDNSLQEDIYSKKMANLAGSMLYILLMIFNILAVFQII